MVQEIITYTIIAAAVIYTLFRFAKIFFPSGNKKERSCCGSCSGCAVKTLNFNKITVISYNDL